jgi:CheY-like chemotaxis protein
MGDNEINRQGGYIAVDSAKGIGTTFFVYLPASDQPVSEEQSIHDIATPEAGFKILLMDDEETILQAAGEMLRVCFGYRVVITTDGAGAIELYKQAKETGEPFDAVIMDLNNPGGMGGEETIACLREFDPDIKAIVSSGYANSPVMADYKRFGFCGAAVKPYNFDELNDTLNRVIRKREKSG